MAKSNARAKQVPAIAETAVQNSIEINGATGAKFLLFPIPVADRVLDGPIMRGFLDLGSDQQVQVGAWKRIGKESGTEYLSLKVANTKKPDENASPSESEEYLVGPYYGRLFKEIKGQGENERVRYFGYIEHSEKVGIDAGGQNIYQTYWQLQINARPQTSGDQKRYIGGTVNPKGESRDGFEF